jgi:hypothetical protein
MRYLALIFLLYFSHLGKTYAQTLPSTSLAITTQQYNLSSFSPDLNFIITLANPPTDINGNLPQSLRINLVVHYPNSNGTKSFSVLGSSYWANGSFWSPGQYATNSNSIAVGSSPIAMYFNSLATANFLATIPTGRFCVNDTIWYEIQTKYYANSNGTAIISWQSNGTTDSIAESQHIGITKVQAGQSWLNNLHYTACKGDTTCQSVIDVSSSNSSIPIDSIKVEVTVPVGATFVGFKDANGTFITGATSYTTVGSLIGLDFCISFPASFAGSGYHKVTYTIYACGQTQNHVQDAFATVISCGSGSGGNPPAYTFSCSISPSLKCIQVDPCVSQITYNITRSDTTSFGYYDVVLQVPTTLRAFSASVPAALIGSAYTITASSTNCTSLSGYFTSTGINLNPAYTCGSSALQVTIRITDTLLSFNYDIKVLARYDSGIANNSTLLFGMTIKDTSNSFLISNFSSALANLCTDIASSNKFVVGNNVSISQVMANPGAIIPCMLTYASSGVPDWLSIYDIHKIGVKYRG